MDVEARVDEALAPVDDLFPWVVASCRTEHVRLACGLRTERPLPPHHYIGPDGKMCQDVHRVRGWADPFDAASWIEAHRHALPLGFGQYPFLCYRGS